MKIIRVLDFETSGIAPPAHVIEVGACDLVFDDGAWQVDMPEAHLCGGGTITAETRAIHHISPAEILGLAPFDAATFVADARRDEVIAIAAHHADFEGKWIGADLGGLPLICTYKAALRVWPEVALAAATAALAVALGERDAARASLAKERACSSCDDDGFVYDEDDVPSMCPECDALEEAKAQRDQYERDLRVAERERDALRRFQVVHDREDAARVAATAGDLEPLVASEWQRMAAGLSAPEWCTPRETFALCIRSAYGAGRASKESS